MILKEPKTPLPVGYRPSGSVPRKVTDKDSWAAIAAEIGVDVLWLIQYNFETRDPAEVNWYLKHRVGCTKTTPSGKNLVFSAAARPGLIYVPTSQLVRSLRNLSYGGYGIAIAGNQDYQVQVRQCLDWIARSDTGLVLLRAIKRTGKIITISPYTETDCNAAVQPADRAAATPVGQPVLVGGHSFEFINEVDKIRDLLGLQQEALMGSGKGSNSDLTFTPAMFESGAGGACSSFAGKPGASPSQVLFHELCHAYRAASGAFLPRPTTFGSVLYTNMEEFFAVVLSNVLISDPTFNSGNRTLRAHHAGFKPLDPTLSTTHGFLSHIPNRNKMRELVASDPDLTRDLAGVRSYFNPFAEVK
jgi:hypothetical protein